MDDVDDRKKAAALAMQQLIKQKTETTEVPEWVEAPEIPLPEEEVPTGASQKQIQERIRKQAAAAANGFNTTAMGVGMRDLGFAISKSRGDAGQENGARINVKAIAQKAETLVNRKKYSLEDLKTKTLPDVKANEKEEYLNDEDFVVAFGMEREDFAKLAPWKKMDLKKKAGLF